jgi:hypothetical protein
MPDTTPTTPDQPTTVEHPRFRRTRIAVSVFFGVVSVLLVVMWVRSYWKTEEVRIYADTFSLGIVSYRGLTGVSYISLTSFLPNWTDIHFSTPLGNVGFSTFSIAITEEMEKTYDTKAKLGFSIQSTDDSLLVWLPVWLPLALLVSTAALFRQTRSTWTTRRFSLRTMLTITTLVAAMLGLIAWTSS